MTDSSRLPNGDPKPEPVANGWAITADDALRALDGCTECPHWVAAVIRDELETLGDALAAIYAA